MRAPLIANFILAFGKECGSIFFALPGLLLEKIRQTIFLHAQRIKDAPGN
jgi:hypothetical protein